MSTGFTREQSAATLTRDGGLCGMLGYRGPGCHGRATTANHRQNRQAGGSKHRNGMSNAAAICGPCNSAIESDAAAAEEARRRGVKVDENRDPATVPLWSPFLRQWIQPGDEWATLIGNADPLADARDLADGEQRRPADARRA